MSIVGKLTGGLLIAGAAVAGSYVGEGLRREEDAGGETSHGMATSDQEFELQRLLRSALPAIALALLVGRPRTLFAFIGGLLIAMLFGGRGQLQEVFSDLSVGRAGGT